MNVRSHCVLRCYALHKEEFRVGGACGPPPPVVAPRASSLRTPSRGDPPLNLSPMRGGLPVGHGGDRPQHTGRWDWRCRYRPHYVLASLVEGGPPRGRSEQRWTHRRRATLDLPLARHIGPNTSPPSFRLLRAIAALPYREPAPHGRQVKRGVAAGRSAQRACSRSNDWRRGARRAPPTRNFLSDYYY
jgi:hypothetical protein